MSTSRRPAPAAPMVMATGGTSLSVTWEAPRNTGPDLSGYDVGYREVGSSTWSDAGHDGVATKVAISGLTMGLRLPGAGACAQRGGREPVVAVCGARTASVPAQPVGLAAEGGAKSVTLTWQDAGDSSITRWQYRQREGADAWSAWTDIPDSGAAHHGLRRFRARGVRLYLRTPRESTPRARGRRPRPAGRPLPTPISRRRRSNLQATAGAGQAVLTWQTPDLSAVLAPTGPVKELKLQLRPEGGR